MQIRQVHDVEQGGSGWFEVRLSPRLERRLQVALRLQRLTGTGSAVFDDGKDERIIGSSGLVEVRGVIASDWTGGLSLTAWPDGARQPAATAFFDVLHTLPSPRIFWNGRDVTGTTQSVVVGQQIGLAVALPPGLTLRDQEWSIESPGEYVGGFMHTATNGGPQPVNLHGPETLFYWVTPGLARRVIYRLTLANGETAAAAATFDVQGPSYADVVVPTVDVRVGPGTAANSSYLGFAGTGISFHAEYVLPEGLLKNYTWVQLISGDYLQMTSKHSTLKCVPKTQPEAELGAGLDTGYPYDTHNPTRDIPPMELKPDAEEIARMFHAQMYLLWTSGLSNSIAVPLGYVKWYFYGRALRSEEPGNHWVLKSGSAGPEDGEQPFTPTRAYPMWSSLVPYTGVMSCK